MSFGSRVETDLGAGTLTLDGETTATRWAVALPILVHPFAALGLEFRPTWAERVSDYDLALLLTWRCASLKAGYRWLATPHEVLDGPYLGLSLRL